MMRSAQAQFGIFAICAALCAQQRTDAIKRLPSPDARYAVARIGYDWIDKSRPETLSNVAGTHREIMVFVWYPTDPGHEKKAAEYLPGAKILEKSKDGEDMKSFWGDAWALVASDRIASDTAESSPVANGKEKFPLIVFTPGQGVPSTAYTTLIEEVVSHGYIVASIEPTYEAPAVVFPDGRVIRSSEAATGRNLPAPPNDTREKFLQRLHAFNAIRLDRWAGDIRFTVDQIASLNHAARRTAPFSGRVDLNNIAAWGHSLGGLAAPIACQLDHRIKACLNADGLVTDGPIFRYDGTNLPSQPFLWMEVFHEPPPDALLAQWKMTRKDWDKNHQTQLANNEQELKEYPGRSYHVTINLPGINHYSFTDKPLIDSDKKEDLDLAVHALNTIESYTLSFFDQYLKQKNNHLLDGTTADQKDIVVESFGLAHQQ